MNTATNLNNQADIFGFTASEAEKLAEKIAKRESRQSISRQGDAKREEAFTSPQQAFLKSLEGKLQLKRHRMNGKDVLDVRRLPVLYLDKTTKPITGFYRADELVGLSKEGMIILAQHKALAKLADLFEDRENERLLYEGLALLTLRLRKMRPSECPIIISNVFVEHYAQQDFMSNERTGETIRNNRKRAGAESRRRAAGISARPIRSVKSANEADIEKPAQAHKPHLLSVDRLLSVISSKPSVEDEEEL